MRQKKLTPVRPYRHHRGCDSLDGSSFDRRPTLVLRTNLEDGTCLTSQSQDGDGPRGEDRMPDWIIRSAGVHCGPGIEIMDQESSIMAEDRAILEHVDRIHTIPCRITHGRTSWECAPRSQRSHEHQGEQHERCPYPACVHGRPRRLGEISDVPTTPHAECQQFIWSSHRMCHHGPHDTDRPLP